MFIPNLEKWIHFDYFFSHGLVQPPTRPGFNNKSCFEDLRIYISYGSPHQKTLEVPATKLGQFVGKLSGNIQQPQPATSCGQLVWLNFQVLKWNIVKSRDRCWKRPKDNQKNGRFCENESESGWTWIKDFNYVSSFLYGILSWFGLGF